MDLLIRIVHNEMGEKAKKAMLVSQFLVSHCSNITFSVVQEKERIFFFSLSDSVKHCSI